MPKIYHTNNLQTYNCLKLTNSQMSKPLETKVILKTLLECAYNVCIYDCKKLNNLLYDLINKC